GSRVYGEFMQKQARPIGVTIIALLAILVGVIGLVAGVAMAAFSSMFASIGFGVGGLLSTLGYIIAGVVLFFGLIWVLTGWGFMNGKGWARTLCLIFSILSLIGTIFVAASGSISGIAGVAIWIIMLYYLFTPPVKSFFGSSPGLSATSGGSFNTSSVPRPSLPTSFANPMGGSSFGSGSSNTSGNSGNTSSNLSGSRFCTNCGATLSAGSNKCSSCGKSY
ncbi:MAG TPA: zinc ribbon domain-containing protein, partial [Candidatus Binatus sp.]|nr:zinc ribbon domain-containing protein [Candidatus Binatus sp.]